MYLSYQSNIIIAVINEYFYFFEQVLENFITNDITEIDKEKSHFLH